MKTILAILVIVIMVLQYRLWFADDGILKVLRLKHTISELQAKNDSIAKHNADLTEEINTLKQGGAAIENKARGDLGMVKKGEVFYQIVK
jgi:cell division protein FtsB